MIGSKGLRLLLVDDEARFLATTKILLEKRGVDVFTATSGRDAVRMLEQQAIDVVILDVKMPGEDGVEVLRQIKRDHPMVEVIMLTGHASVTSAVEGLKLGAFDYLMKPCEIPVLLEKAYQALDQKRAREEKIRRAKVARIISHPMAVFEDREE